MYYVVTKRLADAMQGSRIHRNDFSGTCRAICSNATKAAKYILDNKLQAAYTIVYVA